MSALAWLFGLGFLALAGPLLFHLIRRTPKGEIPFSSLMFLRPTPPRLTRRSRLDNLLLLLLRMAALALIAAAFMRPFFNSNVKLDFGDLPGRKTAVLIDTSASMQRDDLWDQAQQKLKQVFDQLDANDQIAVFTFDRQLEKRVDYTKKSNASSLLQTLKELGVQPNWNASQLGEALVDAANRLLQTGEQSQAAAEQDRFANSIASKLQIVVISDMQAGSPTAALQSFRWPEQVKVRFEPVVSDAGSNATLELLPVDESDLEQVRENVLVRNSAESTSDQFSVSWQNSTIAATPFMVPAGSSKILRVTRDAASQSASKLVLTGDDANFDNHFFAIPPLKQTVSIHYLGDDSPDDPEGMLYYFKRSLIESATTTFNLQQIPSASDLDGIDFDGSDSKSTPPDFLVVTRPVSEKEKQSVDSLLKRGVTLLVACSDRSMLESTRSWTGITKVGETANDPKTDYAMLGNIDFSHPALAPFSGPRFNDFTQVRFWESLKPTLSDNVQVLARFDDDTPAIWHQLSNDTSDIYVFGFGWQPAKSQLALSSKFLPLMMRLIELATKTDPIAANHIVGDSIKVPTGYDRFVTASGDVTFVESDTPQRLDAPGVYSFTSSSNPEFDDVQIAVNLDPSESQTDAMPVDQFSALGVNVGLHSTSEQEVDQQRQLLDFELENRQKLWKWLVLGAIGLIVGESWLAGKTDRATHSEQTGEQGTSNEQHK